MIPYLFVYDALSRGTTNLENLRHKFNFASYLVRMSFFVVEQVVKTFSYKFIHFRIDEFFINSYKKFINSFYFTVFLKNIFFFNAFRSGENFPHRESKNISKQILSLKIFGPSSCTFVSVVYSLNLKKL